MKITKEQKITAAWITVNTIVGVSTRMVIATAIANLVPTETKADKAKVLVGSYCISHVVAEQTTAYARREIKELIQKTRETLDQTRIKKSQTP